uniref:Secreted protein n=1 Tax=Cannabis sativa TaxID=3483 RepID=A0A803PB86_CANSA
MRIFPTASTVMVDFLILLLLVAVGVWHSQCSRRKYGCCPVQLRIGKQMVRGHGSGKRAGLLFSSSGAIFSNHLLLYR